MLSTSSRFDLVVDRQAKGWLDKHPEASRLFIAFKSSQACCSGVRVCDVRIRVEAASSQVEGRHVLAPARPGRGSRCVR